MNLLLKRCWDGSFLPCSVVLFGEEPKARKRSSGALLYRAFAGRYGASTLPGGAAVTGCARVAGTRGPLADDDCWAHRGAGPFRAAVIVSEALPIAGGLFRIGPIVARFTAASASSRQLLISPHGPLGLLRRRPVLHILRASFGRARPRTTAWRRGARGRRRGAAGASGGRTVRVAGAAARTWTARALLGCAGARAPPPGAVLVVRGLLLLLVLTVVLPVVGSIIVVVSTTPSPLVAAPWEVAPPTATVVIGPAEASVVAPELTVVLVFPWVIPVPVLVWGMGSGAGTRPRTSMKERGRQLNVCQGDQSQPWCHLKI